MILLAYRRNEIVQRLHNKKSKFKARKFRGVRQSPPLKGCVHGVRRSKHETTGNTEIGPSGKPLMRP